MNCQFFVVLDNQANEVRAQGVQTGKTDDTRDHRGRLYVGILRLARWPAIQLSYSQALLS